MKTATIYWLLIFIYLFIYLNFHSELRVTDAAIQPYSTLNFGCSFGLDYRSWSFESEVRRI